MKEKRRQNKNPAGRKRVAAAVTAVTLAAVLLTGTFAWTDYTQHKTNALRGGGAISVTLNDLFAPPDNWQPGGLPVDKKISVSNTAGSGGYAYIRLEVKEYMEYRELAPVVEAGEEVLFATYADGGDKGEYMAWADAQAGGYEYTKFTVDGTDYARTQNAETRNGIYGKHMYVPGATVVFGTAGKADPATLPHTGQDAAHPECLYNGHGWNGACAIDSPAQSGGQNIHAYIDINLGAAVKTVAQWVSEGELPGNFWVLDTDGWAYWANALPPNATTANLVESLALKEMPGSSFEYYLHVDMQAVSVDQLTGFEADCTAEIAPLIQKLKNTESGGWTDNGDGTATLTHIINGELTTGATVIIGLDGIPGTSDDNCLVNPAGAQIADGMQVLFETAGPYTGQPYVYLGNEFKLRAGPDGKIGTQDDVIAGFGAYAQTSQSMDETDPLSWRLLSIDEETNTARVVCATVLDKVVYDNAVVLGSYDFVDSDYYAWLNNTFYNKAFTGAEQGKIATTLVKTPSLTINLLDLIQVTLQAQPDCTANVWALSVSEARQYFGVPKDGYTNATIQGNHFSQFKGAYHDATGRARWLTRSRTLGQVLAVDPDGGLNAKSFSADGCGALPALTIKLM